MIKYFKKNFRMAGAFWRRREWFTYGLTWKKFYNIVKTGLFYVLKSEKTHSYPVAIKIDISPVCQLKCISCIHATPNGDPTLEKQNFKGGQRMDEVQFQKIIDEIKDYTSAVSLYYMGDPLAHPNLDKFCRIAADAGMSVHVGTSFSFHLSDERIKSILTSGVTHFSASVDGLTQEKYERTRVGGDIKLVLHNLERLCRFKKELGLKFPRIEAQYVKFQHNIEEVETTEALVKGYGVDQFSPFWGSLHNYVDYGPDRYKTIGPKKSKALPQCTWPHFNMVIKFDGDVIPCCAYRQGEQYSTDGDARTVGNVFDASVKEVWQSETYNNLRALANNPEKAEAEGKGKNSFCESCSFIHETTRVETARRAAQGVRWEDEYTQDANKIPVRKPEVEILQTSQSS
jgi:MoaA/NifB/PqqE/SkfB family radical SAM enzyme